MGGTRLLLIALLIIASTGIVPGTALADDEYPEWGDCEEAPVLDSGTHSGVFNSPNDEDIIAFNLEKGDYVSFRLSVDEGEENSGVALLGGTDTAFSITAVENAEYWQEDSPSIGRNIDIEGGGIPAYWKYWAEEEGEARHCIVLETGQNGAPVGDIPLNWELQMVVNGEIARETPTPTPTPTSVPTTTPTPAPTATPTGMATDSSDGSTPSPTDDGGSESDIQDSDGDGVIDSEDYAPHDPDVQEKSDLQDTSSERAPGFGVGVAVVALLIGTLLSRRGS